MFVSDAAENLVSERASRVAAFDPWRIAASPALQALVAEVLAGALRVEGHLNLRQRARRPDAARIFAELVEALLCDVLYRHLLGKPVRITRNVAQLARASRYAPDLMSKQLPATLDLLSRHMPILSQTLGSRSAMHSHQTEIAAGPWLVDRIKANAFTLKDITRRAGEEILLRKAPKNTDSGDLQEYTDDDHTRGLRLQVQAINLYLQHSDIDFDAAAAPDKLIDRRDCHLKRGFTYGSWRSGGRLQGGWWINLPKKVRLRGTQINGENVVSLDYQSMAASLLYAHVGQLMPPRDAYTLPRVCGKSIPRDTVKQLFNAALFVTTPFKRWPAKITPAEGVPAPAVMAALAELHPAIGPQFYTNVGHQLQYLESTVLVDVLLRLKEADVPALPIHDCLLVAQSDRVEARAAMQAVFQHHTGFIPGITEEYPP